MGKARRTQAGSSKFESEAAGLDRHALYQQAVQYPPGDIYWVCKFYRQYIGAKAPCHLREDFCGTALISATWCRQDVRRTATGIDLDGEVLQWGLQHNSDGCQQRLCLVQGNVLQPPSSGKIMRLPDSASSTPGSSIQQQQQQQQQSKRGPDVTSQAPQEAAAAAAALESLQPFRDPHTKEVAGVDARTASVDDDDDDTGQATLEQLASKPPDIICAFNFSACLLHTRPQLLAYFKSVAASLCGDPGGVFVLDLMGGHSVEQVAIFRRTNFKSGLRYTFEQERYNPLAKTIRCHITLQDPSSQRLLRRAFTYNWRLWSVADVAELLREAGFSHVAVWVKQLQGSGGRPGADESSDQDAAQRRRHSSSSSEEEDSSDSGSAAEAEAASSDVDDDGDDEAPYVEFSPSTASSAYLNRLARGWTAYVVAVVRPS